ncbi:MAG TPA: adenylate/guanylate cyclase domain-containing protein [Casimicrobiaceae bacterium]|nr:adenylate/guanylate cyclase domain-containing protein [Casimicrobiaceae bacterium]
MAQDQRRLAAIVSADVAGYSRLMGRDESSTLAALKTHRRELIDPKIAEYGGRIVKTTGDGLLLEFPSVVDAIRCAVEVQRGMAERNASVAADGQMAFRIGINVGDIIVDGDDIYGDGVNIAARLEALAEPGGICVSAIVRDQAHVELGVEFTDFGERNVKNIERPIRVFRVGFPTGSKATPAGAVRSQEAPSIAVLPFVNRSHDEEDEYFSDGLADELLNVLAKIRGLQVAARSSAFTFKGKSATLAEVGHMLNVATVLEGSVRKAGNRMRISVQLVKVSDGYQLWSESYDRTLEDIFAVQDDIAQSVVRELRTTLLGQALDASAEKAATEAVAAAAKGRATDPEAHRFYLQARYLVARATHEDVAKSIGYLKEALALDPQFAVAWAELGTMYAREASRGWVPVVEGYGRGREAVMHALTLEPALAEGHVALGWIQMSHDWDLRKAEASCRRALALAPGSVLVMRRASAVIGWLGHLDEAIELSQRALAQDPLSGFAYANLADCLYRSGRLAEAEAAYRKALELHPQRLGTHAHLALNLLAQGRGEEALAEVQQEPEEWERLWAKAIIDHAAGRPAESEVTPQELIAKHQAEAAYQVALVYAARAETDLAFAWLERSYVQRDPGLGVMKTDPSLRALHADRRWGAFLRNMGFDD